MTAPTPEQMRELAELEVLDYRTRMNDVRAALCAAADQLEAVQRVADSHRTDAETAACIVSVRLDAILTADIAPK